MTLTTTYQLSNGVEIPIVGFGTWQTPDGARVRDASYHGEMNLTLTGILEQSSNVGMSMLGTTISQKVRYDYLRKYGLGEETAVDFQGEARGAEATRATDSQGQCRGEDRTPCPHQE